jgi:multidrug efflux pump subunit AcrA (membrane-fusion protein)
VQLRQELEFSPQQQQDKTYLVVKDPLTKRYFRFTAAQATILDLMREPILDEVLARRASEKLNRPVALVTIHAFLDSLAEKCLLDTPDIREQLSVHRGRQLPDSSFLYWRIASFDPDRIFAWLLPRTRWAFTRAFNIFGMLAILAGIVFSYQNWAQMTRSAESLLSLNGLFLVWLVIFVVITIHEFAHGLTCCHFGGKVHEVGFMLIYFQPAFYCDVSDSWMFPSRRNRMWVTAAGGYFQLVVWGLSAVVWRIADTDTLINQIALIIVLFGGFQTLVNFNPLIKLDGYYMLSDYLEIPNLRAKAVGSFWNWIGLKHRSKRPWTEERAELIYATASIIFSTTLLIYVYSYLYAWATAQYAFAGLVGFAVFSAYTLRRTALESIVGLRAFAARAATRKYRNLGIIAAGLLITFVGRWELKIPADFKVIARNEMTVRPETAGTVVELLVREGSRVAKGDALARLRNFEKQQDISELSGELDTKRRELELLRAGARAEEIDRKQKLVETKKVELGNARRNLEQRNQLEQMLERKRSELNLERQNLKRTQDLVSSGLVARAELEKAETAVSVREREVAETQAAIRVVSESGDREADLKQRELDEAQSELRLMLAGSRPELLRQQEAGLKKLENQVSVLQQELDKTEIRAPIDGVVATPFVERKLNQYLEAGGELLRLVDTGRVTVEMLIPEKELADVKIGNPVWMKLRSFPDMALQGRVDFIAPVAQSVDSGQMVVVRSELVNDTMLLKPDMTGVAMIYCGDRRIAELMTRRLVRWIRTEFWHILP